MSEANGTGRLQMKDIAVLIESDQWMMGILRNVRDLDLPDWWIGAGFVRSKVWDVLHGVVQRTPLTDVDVAYFDTEDTTALKEWLIEVVLSEIDHTVPWSVTNQARMHVDNGDEPYTSSEDAISRWPETATCIAVRLNCDDRVEITAPHGIDDLVDLIVRPTPAFTRKVDIYEGRIEQKAWQSKWPKLKVIHLRDDQ
ncbi:MAG TPA: nucleotidyltransferase family protein [Blastocatellia bacterium]|nr:nucleotidyltransferase family protein [Blastocatellia bacterium]